MSTDISRKRHIAKTITWRIIASGTTFLIALFFFYDNEQAVSKATSVAIVELVIKMLMYYFHERLWYKSDFGLKNRKSHEK